MRTQDPELYDHNVHAWLGRESGSYLLRLLRSDHGTETHGVMRAMLSQSYRAIDNLDRDRDNSPGKRNLIGAPATAVASCNWR